MATQKETIKSILKDVLRGRVDSGESVDDYLERRAKQIANCLADTSSKSASQSKGK